MTEAFSRTERLLGAAAMDKLAASRVAVFGLGGVGGYVVEALARSGVGQLDLVDNDRICPSNLNRQILATHSSLGRYKTDAAADRVRDIAPGCLVRCWRTFFLPETADAFDFSAFDYVVDAIDTVTGKLELAVRCQAAGTPQISSMGTGNKLDPSALCVADLYETAVDPLARVMRRELRKRGVRALKVVYSREEPRSPAPEMPEAEEADEETGFVSRRRATPGSTAFVPPAAGLLLASEVVRDLILTPNKTL